jgi:hypothetical protein
LSAGSIGTTAASDAIPAGRPLPGSPPVIGRHAPAISTVSRAGDGLPSSRRHLPNVPSPLRRGVLHGCAPRIFTASMAFALRDGARLSLVPLVRAHSRRGRLRLTLRTARSLPLQGLLTLGFDPARFQTEPPACYRAPWRLPGPDLHRLATTSFRSSQVTSSSTSPLSISGCTPDRC